MAGAGSFPHAALLTGLVVFVNLGLRPLVKWIKRHTLAGRPILRQFQVSVSCELSREGEVRGFLLRVFGVAGLRLVEIAARPGLEAGFLDITATVTGEGATQTAIDAALARLAAEPGLARVSWQALEEG